MSLNWELAKKGDLLLRSLLFLCWQALSAKVIES
jgi:hypothetical protein